MTQKRSRGNQTVGIIEEKINKVGQRNTSWWIPSDELQ